MHPALAGLVGVVGTLAVLALVLLLRWAFRNREQAQTQPGTKASPDAVRAVAGMPIAAMVVGSQDEVLTANESAQALGLARGRRVGFKELLTLVRTSREGDEPYFGPIHRDRMPGTEVLDLNGSVTPLSEGMVMVVAEDESESQRVDAVRRDFVANISHELKTPIGAIGILTEAIEAASDDPEAVSRFVERLHHESARLAELVGQIIELSRLQSAAPTTQEVVEIDDILDDAMNRARVVATKRGVNLIRNGDKDLKVFGDRWQLTDAVTNLVQNAIVYSDMNARVAVSVGTGEADGDDVIEIKVADNGIGIKPEDQERIFERFYRVDYGRSRESGGTGLGLSIVRHIAVAHGGSIHLWSKPDQGSTFTLRLPQHIPADGDEES